LLRDRLYSFLTTIRREAFNGGDITFGNAAIVKVLETLNTEYMGADEKSVAYGAFLRVWKASLEIMK
jgi:hypothetical protein